MLASLDGGLITPCINIVHAILVVSLSGLASVWLPSSQLLLLYSAACFSPGLVCSEVLGKY